METTVPEWAKSRGWGEAALAACLERLNSSRVTQAWTVQVLDSWTEAGVAFCVVYRYPYFEGVLGIRRTFDEDVNGDRAVDPGQFGRDVADYDIGEPLGTVADRLRLDESGIAWWGDLDEDELPRPPFA